MIIGGLVVFLILPSILILYFNTQSSDNRPQGEAPAGKVWSEEHRHWHDAE